MTVPPIPQPAVIRHTPTEDVLAMVTGTFLASLGLFLLRSADAVTGGTAGVALLISVATGLPLSVLLIVVNVPFFALAVWLKGWAFTLKTVAGVAAIALFSELHQWALGEVHLPALYAALGGNLMIGVGILVLFRHGASLGGFNVLALILQERFGWRAGYVQMALDVLVVLAALAVVPFTNVLMSALGAVVLNIVLALNHRPGRYLGG